MKRMYDLILTCWAFAKWMFEQPINEIDDWSRILKAASNLAEKYKDNRKENAFMRAVLGGILDWYEIECREEKLNDKRAD